MKIKAIKGDIYGVKYIGYIVSGIMYSIIHNFCLQKCQEVRVTSLAETCRKDVAGFLKNSRLKELCAEVYTLVNKLLSTDIY